MRFSPPAMQALLRLWIDPSRCVAILAMSLLTLCHSSQPAHPGDVDAALSEKALQEMRMQEIERAKDFDLLRKGQEIEAGAPGIAHSEQAPSLPEDVDDDGMADSWEQDNGLNPGNPADAWLDPDGDHVVNLFEYQLGSGLNNPATPPVVTVAPSGAMYTSVSEALRAAVPGACIRIAEGTYRVNYMTFSPRTVMIQGGWSADFSTRDLAQHPTTLDGGMEDEILYFSTWSSSQVVHVAIALDGLRFIRGNGSFGAVNLLAQGSSTTMKTSLLDCTIADSLSSFSFGGVLNMNNWTTSTADRTVANSVIAGNTASGIYAQITDPSVARWRIINSTISGNTNGGSDNGYGIDVFTLRDGRLDARVSNTILWGNERDDLDFRRDITFAADYSDIDRVTTYGTAVYQPGPGMLNADPLFVDPANGNYRLSVNSPCIDAGLNASGPPTDRDGKARPVDGNNDGQALCDMGAYEYAASVGPDLIVRDGWIQPAAGLPGQTIQIGFRVENQGVAAAAQANWTHVSLSEDATYSPNDWLWIEGIQIPGLSPGQGHDYSASAAIPLLPSAAYHVLVYCDVNDALAESNEQNNWRAIGVLILPTRAHGWFLYR